MLEILCTGQKIDTRREGRGKREEARVKILIIIDFEAILVILFVTCYYLMIASFMSIL